MHRSKQQFVNLPVVTFILATTAALNTGIANASVDQNEALTLCQSVVKNTYGEDAHAKFTKIKKRKGHLLTYRIRVGDVKFKATCKVDYDGEVTLDPAKVPSN